MPSGATTGPISVTSPGGSAVSSTNFVVGDSTAPTITSFSPTIGTAGTAVTITGTNFDQTSSNNRVEFNATLASLTSNTSTALQTNVPPATGSGRISVATVAGTATSTADFFIPPSPHAPSAVEVTGRMAIGENRTVALTNARQPIQSNLVCADCDPQSGGGGSSYHPANDPNFSTARGRPENEAGEPGVDLGSRNFNWSLPLL